MKTMSYSVDEQLVSDAILEARKVQEYIWQELSFIYNPFEIDKWVNIFQKRVNKIQDIDISHPNHKVELRKRILQQAALSIMALRILDNSS